MAFMFRHSSFYIVGDARIQYRIVHVCHYVYIICFHYSVSLPGDCHVATLLAMTECVARILTKLPKNDF